LNCPIARLKQLSQKDIDKRKVQACCKEAVEDERAAPSSSTELKIKE